MKNLNALSLWNEPWSPLSELRRDLDRLFEDWFTPSFQGYRAAASPILPACDVQEAPDHFFLNLELAGVRKEDIQLEVMDNKITISGERRDERRKGEEENGRIYSERRFGHFQRILTLPVGVKSDEITAHYEDGILQVMLPKAESAKPKIVKILNGGIFKKGGDPTIENKKEKTQLEAKAESGPDPKLGARLGSKIEKETTQSHKIAC